MQSLAPWAMLIPDERHVVALLNSSSFSSHLVRLGAILLLVLPLHTLSWGTEAQDLQWPDLIPDHIKQMQLQADPVDHFSTAIATQSSLDIPMEQLVVAELHQRLVRISGFLVPLGLNDRNLVDQFLLVPYFGACIHTPPPPPNQIVYIVFPDGLTADNLYDPFTLTGRLEVGAISSTALADTGYRMVADFIDPYKY